MLKCFCPGLVGDTSCLLECACLIFGGLKKRSSFVGAFVYVFIITVAYFSIEVLLFLLLWLIKTLCCVKNVIANVSSRMLYTVAWPIATAQCS